jgi:nondiscriminating glutamyl-tRNA synthetase
MSQYRDLGYLPEAIFNFILLLGWSPEGTQEIFTKQQAIDAFDAKRLSSSPSMFDPQKMNWLNNYYIKQLTEENYWAMISPFVKKAPGIENFSETQLKTLSNLFKEQILYGAQIIDLIKPILSPTYAFDEETNTLLSSTEGKQALSLFIEKFKMLSTIDGPSIKAIFKSIQLETGLKGKPLFMPVRLKLTGQLHGAELANIIPMLGKDMTLQRLLG